MKEWFSFYMAFFRFFSDQPKTEPKVPFEKRAVCKGERVIV